MTSIKRKEYIVMIKKTFYMPDKIMEKLAKEAEERGVSMSEILRSILDKYFSEKK